MSGDPDKASIWNDADVYIGDVTATLPADIDTPFDGSWDLVGLLDGDAGFEEDRSWDSSDFFAWGNLLVRTSRKNFVLTRKFTALEENAVTNGLVWPGSVSGERAVPKANHRFKAAFETTDDGVNKKKRVVTRKHAEVEEVGTIKDSESDLTKLEITVKIYPDAEGILFDIQPDDNLVTLVSVDLAPATLAIGIGDYAPLVLTATYSDASTRDVTAAATWSTSTPAKATVDRGYVKGVAAGTSNVTGTFRGQAGTCAVTVS
jgi:hypothetical protein